MIDWFTTTIPNDPEDLPMDTLSLRTSVCNAASVFVGEYGAVARQAGRAGCSRQTVYEHARRVERRLEAAPAAAARRPPPALDDDARRRFAVEAFAMGLSTRQVEDLLRIVLDGDGPDHSTIGRWVAEAAARAGAVLEAADAACVPRVRTLALDELFFGGGRPWSGSSRRA
ncbi:hypothetical protein [Paludisphaera soli]|uniref:hypothetical protein n=1 Tax=Paludisphaera soli TaxID=2712865 RepID=UPI0013EBD313|nr:hypothetical protein [Paludisphaera soli]